MDDNHNPLKGPFKGKGINRQILRELEIELESIKAEMKEVMARFDKTLRLPRPVNLRLSRTRTYPILWWRMTGRNGTYIRLFDSEAGTEILARLLPRTIKLLMDFDEDRIRLNCRAGMFGNAVEGYFRRERDLAILEQHKQRMALERDSSDDAKSSSSSRVPRGT